jgi:hypothetical protein
MKTRLVLTLSLVLCTNIVAQETTWWRSLTPNQSQVVDCELARDDKSLARLLRPLGWDEKKFPNIDWTRSHAVVIAPNVFHRGYHLSFIKELKQERAVDFRWGWAEGNSAVADGGFAGSIGSASEGKEAIVVRFPKDDLTGRAHACHENQ